MNKRLPITAGRLLVLIVGMPLVLLLIGGLAIGGHGRFPLPVRELGVLV